MNKNLRYVILTAALQFLFIGTGTAQSFDGRPTPFLRQKLNQNKSDTTRVKILLALSRGLLFKPGADQKDLDSASLILQQAKSLAHELHDAKSEGRTWLMEALLLNRKKKNDQGLQAAQKALVIFTKTKDPLGQADADVIIGQYYLNTQAQITIKIGYYKKAAAMFFKAGARERAATTLKDLGDLQILDNHFNDAFQSLRSALAIYQSIGYKDLQGTYDLIGYNLIHMGDISGALKYSLLAVRTAEVNSDTSMQLCTIYNRAGLVYSFAKKHEKASEYYNKALKLAYKYSDTTAIIQISASVAAALINNNRLSSALTIIKKMKSFKDYQSNPDIQISVTSLLMKGYLKNYNFGSAKVYFEQLLGNFGKTDLQPDIYANKVLNSIILYYQATKQFEKSYPYIIAHQQFCTENRLGILMNSDELYLFKADSATGKYQSAIQHYQRYKANQESLINERNSKQTALLEIQYDAEKKDRDIQLKANNIILLTKKAQLQLIRFQQELDTRNWIVAATVLLLLVLVVGYNRYRLKQRSNLLLQAQQAEINSQNQSLLTFNLRQTTLLKEKEWLLREIHHRVKNNLQITMSLLNIQSAYMDNNAALEAIQDSQRRMQAMSLIHQKLYQSDNLALINMSVYIPELVRYLKESLDGTFPLQFDIQVQEIKLDIVQAVPVGLILNEAITNAIKYAFPGNRTGMIRIAMYENEYGWNSLTIADDGVGLPPNFKRNNHHSLGMNLMRGLTDQLQGEFKLESLGGTTISVVFAGINLMEEELYIIEQQENSQL